MTDVAWPSPSVQIMVSFVTFQDQKYCFASVNQVAMDINEQAINDNQKYDIKIYVEHDIEGKIFCYGSHSF